jgi:hypothetical protein
MIGHRRLEFRVGERQNQMKEPMTIRMPVVVVKNLRPAMKARAAQSLKAFGGYPR